MNSKSVRTSGGDAAWAPEVISGIASSLANQTFKELDEVPRQQGMKAVATVTVTVEMRQIKKEK